MTLQRLHPRVRLVAQLELVGRDEAAVGWYLVAAAPSLVVIAVWLWLVLP